MKKILAFCLCFLVSFSLFGCKEKQDPTMEIQKDVTMELLDVLKVTNETNNTVYYYFLANVSNDSKTEFSTESIVYEITDEANANIRSIDSYQNVNAQTIQPKESTFIYGYVGYPNNNQENMGIALLKKKLFLPFSSVKVREISDQNIRDSQEDTFTLYKDGSFQFDVDASNIQYCFEYGKSKVKGLKITYQNKTDQHLVVPFVTPKATLTGFDLNHQPDSKKLLEMSEEEIKKVDMKAKTITKVEGVSTGYECFYLPAKQTVECDIVFVFDHVVPDFHTSNSNAIVIDLNSASFGYSQSIQVQL